MSDRMQSPLISVLRARLLIGFLGERAQFGWWPTAFHEPSGRLFLEPIFPKTLVVAQYHGVLEAACRLHDEHLSAGSYHLFRLPEEMEPDLHALVQRGSDELSPTLLYPDKQTALDALNDMAVSVGKDGIGPVLVGRVDDIAENLAEIASVYRSAFSSGTQSFPYLVS